VLLDIFARLLKVSAVDHAFEDEELACCGVMRGGIGVITIMWNHFHGFRYHQACFIIVLHARTAE
jgi:hypothetical protein